MAVAPDAVEIPQAASRRTFWSADNALVRAVGRIPLPLGAKLLIGFAVVGALLAIGYVLGLVALGQSNSRGEQLRSLQQKAVYEQLLLTDAKQLRRTIDHHIHFVSTKPLGAAYDEAAYEELSQLCQDAGLPTQCTRSFGSDVQTLRPLTLRTIDPALFNRLRNAPLGFAPAVGGVPNPPGFLEQADTWAGSIVRQLGDLVRKTRIHANELVAADHSSFARSRDLLIGVGSGSLVLALVLGLLLAWSVVAPLRRTESHLDEIAAGDFSGRLDVANRDEIGRLAAKVNSTSDELERVHRELELASEHKSQFLANMSHELRTPLNAIIGFSEILREQMFGELNERQLAYVDDVHEAGGHLLSLINDVLDLAKIEAGRMDLELSQVAIADVLRSAVSMHSEQADRSSIRLDVTTDPEEITITADERRVRQIVFNLLSNAVKFTPADGRVDVSARLDDDRVEIAVTDTGPGITAEDQETIFEEFEQTTDGKKAEGTGLGLPLSRKLVELHGGRLWVESEPGHGSTFRFTLPAQQEVS